MKWLDDYFLVSGSRDTSLALWKLDVDEIGDSPDELTRFKALVVKRCRTAEKVRALAFNKQDMEIAALSLNGYIHVWNAAAFKQVNNDCTSIHVHIIEFNNGKNVCLVFSLRMINHSLKK